MAAEPMAATGSVVADPSTSSAEYARRLRNWLADRPELLSPFGSRRYRGIEDGVRHESELLHALYEAGWSRCGWPTEVGGAGGPVTLRALMYDELAAAGADIPEAFVVLETLGPLLTRFAPALAREHLPRFLAGEELWGQGFSEPDAGSDLAALRTRLVERDGQLFLHGRKVWTTLGQLASHAAVLCRSGDEPGHRGLSMVWVDLRTPGVQVRPIRAVNGRDEFAEMYFEDVPVDRQHLLGGLGAGWAAAMYLLQYERGMYAWLRQAMLHKRLREAARRAGSAAVEPADPSITAAYGAAVLLAAAVRVRSWGTVSRLAAGEDPGPEISVDKLLLGQAEQACFDALRMLAGPGLIIGADSGDATLREEWFYSRAATIFGGAAEVQRDIVAERVLGLPRPGRA